MSQMTEIVQFKIRFYQPGDEIYVDEADLLDNLLILNWPVKEDGNTELPFEEVCQLKPKKEIPNDGVIREMEYEKYIIKHPFIHFEPRIYLSESSDWTGLEDDVLNMSISDVFENYLEDILKLANQFGYAYSERHIGKDASKVICVLTLWNYWTDVDYYGEYDSGSDLLGAVKMSDIRKACLTT
jgi:hypothetical protein